jgi:hypothetical protein
MTKLEYIQPQLNLEGFNCPHCFAYSHQNWFTISKLGYNWEIGDFKISVCAKCNKITMWFKDKIIFPFNSVVEPVNIDLPEDIKNDYNEAAFIVNFSPRGAAALLRLAIQKLCKFLKTNGKDINEDIKILVEKGLRSSIQKALDIVRIVGNEAVHPGVIDLKDDKATALMLFKLVNIIATDLITNPKEIEEMYKNLPPEKIVAIENRDKKTS